jgi:hypothetical protein
LFVLGWVQRHGLVSSLFQAVCAIAQFFMSAAALFDLGTKVGHELGNVGVAGLAICQLHWLHVLATDTLNWMACQSKGGNKTFEALALLNIAT